MSGNRLLVHESSREYGLEFQYSQCVPLWSLAAEAFKTRLQHHVSLYTYFTNYALVHEHIHPANGQSSPRPNVDLDLLRTRFSCLHYLLLTKR